MEPIWGVSAVLPECLMCRLAVQMMATEITRSLRLALAGRPSGLMHTVVQLHRASPSSHEATIYRYHSRTS